MTEIPLPTLHEGTLDAAQVRALASDLAACAKPIEVRPKGGAQAYAKSAAPSLEDAIEALLRGDLYGLQLRYLHAGQEWCDTLLPSREVGEGTCFRLIRMQQS